MAEPLINGVPATLNGGSEQLNHVEKHTVSNKTKAQPALVDASYELCPVCTKLDLKAERFFVEPRPHNRSRSAALSAFESQAAPGFVLVSSSHKVQLGSLQTIKAKSISCQFCRLVWKSVEPSPNSSWDPSQETSRCSLHWEIDGRRAAFDGSLKATTRRIHLTWDNEALKDSYIVYFVPPGFFRSNADAASAYEIDALFLGRSIEVDSDKQALLMSWVDICRRHDGICREPLGTPHDLEAMFESSYFGVIDVLNMCLKPLPLRRTPQGVGRHEYVALSYVWGRGNAYRTTLSNVRQHQQQGGLEKFIDRFPLVIRDAMELVKRLGYKYLWVDSLCIVQDSNRSWRLNARNMNLIYGNATLTICAADGVDSSAGLVAMHARKDVYIQKTEQVTYDLKLMVTQTPETSISKTVWNSRAWTFQERILSKRCLIFTEGRVYFQCRAAGMSEDIYAGPEGPKWSLDLVDAPLQVFRVLKKRAIEFYFECIPLYTMRNLTKSNDILAAFEGLANLIGENLHGPLIYGLPTSHLDIALLWETQGSAKRRRQSAHPGNDEIEHPGFPSWSWCGWEGVMSYKTDIIGQCLVDLHEWLTEHTWISWHIRDGRGHLRPLWKGLSPEDDRFTERRWRGYQPRDNDCAAHQRDIEIRARRDALEREMRERKLEYQKDLERGEKGRHERRNQSPDIYLHDENDVRRQRYEEVEEVEYRMPWPQHKEDQIRGRDYSPPPPPRDLVVYDGGHGGQGHASFEPTSMRADLKIADEFGRLISADFANLPPMRRRPDRPAFQQTLLENPYQVVMNDRDSVPDVEFPDQPYLQFFTWYKQLYVQAGAETQEDVARGLRRHDVADEAGDWCGSLLVDINEFQAEEVEKHSFIALSDAKTFTYEECPTWTYYIPKERRQSEWDLFFVLLVKMENSVARTYRRVGLGKVFKHAFRRAQWREIVLG